MHIRHRSLHNITRVILVVWLLAIGMGAANACVLGSQEGGEYTGVKSTHHIKDLASIQAGEEELPDRSGCLAFCDDASLAIAKVGSPVSDPGLEVLSMVHWAWAPGFSSVHQGLQPMAVHQPVHLRPPLAMRPHRLAL